VIGAPPLDAVATAWFVLLALATALLGWRRPAGVPCVLVLVDPFALTRYVGHTTLTSFKAALVGGLVGLLAHGALRWPRERTARATLLVLLVLVAATAATIPHAALRAPAVRETLKAFEYLVVFAVAWAAARGSADASRLFGLACGAAVVLVGVDALRDYLHPQSGLYVRNVPIVRLAGHLEGPNQLAAWLGLALPAAIAEIAAWPLMVAVLIVGGVVCALTLSRGGIAQTAIALGGAVWSRGANRRVTVAVASLAVALALGTLAFSTHTKGTITHVGSLRGSVDYGGTGTRAILWRAAVAMARAHPLLGVGAGNFELELPDYGAPPGVRTQANSLYLEAAADGGLVLLIPTLLAALLPPVLLLRAGTARRLAFVAGVAGLALAAHGVIDDVTFYTKVGQLWWVLAGVAAASAGGSSSSPSETPGTK